MPNKWTGKWDGGRTYLGRDGETVYWMDRSYEGKRFGCRLDAGNLKQAMAELALFQRDPMTYVSQRQARKEAARDSVVLTSDLLERFDAHQVSEGRDPAHVKKTRSYLNKWEKNLRGKDLRFVTLRQLLAIVPEKKGRRPWIVSIKVLCSWLRKQALLPRASDPTLDLKAPQTTPVISYSDKAYDLEHVQKLYASILPWESNRLQDLQPIRDLVLVVAKTGMHITEVGRVARGECKVEEVGIGEIAGIIRFVHKSGRVHVQSVDAQTLGAVNRLVKKGSLPAGDWLKRVLRRAAKTAGVETIRPGSLRHSHVTWAREGGRLVRPAEEGLSLEVVSAAVGHTTPKTTKRFYDQSKVPPMVVTRLVLQNREDPQPEGPKLKLVSSA